MKKKLVYDHSYDLWIVLTFCLVMFLVWMIFNAHTVGEISFTYFQYGIYGGVNRSEFPIGFNIALGVLYLITAGILFLMSIFIKFSFKLKKRK